MGDAKEAATALGHDMEWDPPAHHAAKRWTCVGCGRSAIAYAGQVYGSAVEGACPAGSPTGEEKP